MSGRAASVEPYETKPKKVAENAAEGPKTDPSHASQSGARPKDTAMVRRPITHILDRHDQMIVDLKAQKLGDTQIARILNNEGTNYHSKTIGTRFRRIRLAKMAANDEPLKLKQMHWTKQEDKILLKSHAINIERHEKDQAQLEARFFEDVAFSLNDLEKATFYSPEACKKRYEELIGGNAKPHPDVDDNPHRARDDFQERLAVREKEDTKAKANKGDRWDTVLFNEALGKRVSKSTEKRASGKRRSGSDPPAKKQKLGNHLSDEMIRSEDEGDESSA